MILETAIISGFLSVWFRPCDLHSFCPAPQLYGHSIPVEGKIEAPTHPKSMTSFRLPFGNKLIKGNFNIFWTYPENRRPELITRVDLLDSETGEALGQCTNYGTPQDIFPFPAGSCTVFTKHEDKTYQIGVSFSRVKYGLKGFNF